MWKYLLILSVMAGCDSGPCQERSGTYLVKFESRTDACKSFEKIINLDDAASEGQCTGSKTLSDNNCGELRKEYSCTAADSSVTTTTGDLWWDTDGASASGVFSIKKIEGSQMCSSSFDVTYQRQ